MAPVNEYQKLADDTARDTLATLNRTRDNCGLEVEPQNECRIVVTQAMARLSAGLMVAMQINTKKKFADMMPVIPGK